MSIFLITDTIEVPGEPGSVTIRKLTPTQLKKAAKVAARARMAEWREDLAQHLEMAPILKEVRDIFADDRQLEQAKQEAAQALKADPLGGYDAVTIVQAGVVGWTYTTPWAPEQVEDLIDADAVEYLARAVLRFSRPSLFAEYDAEHAQKKDAAHSTVH